VNSPREFTIDLVGRNEPALGDSNKYRAFLGHNMVTVQRIQFGPLCVNFLFLLVAGVGFLT
jgi:hypothetical protein